MTPLVTSTGKGNASLVRFTILSPKTKKSNHNFFGLGVDFSWIKFWWHVDKTKLSEIADKLFWMKQQILTFVISHLHQHVLSDYIQYSRSSVRFVNASKIWLHFSIARQLHQHATSLLSSYSQMCVSSVHVLKMSSIQFQEGLIYASLILRYFT